MVQSEMHDALTSLGAEHAKMIEVVMMAWQKWHAQHLFVQVSTVVGKCFLEQQRIETISSFSCCNGHALMVDAFCNSHSCFVVKQLPSCQCQCAVSFFGGCILLLSFHTTDFVHNKKTFRKLQHEMLHVMKVLVTV